MSSENCKIKWINTSNRYGLFATRNIPAGTTILKEAAIMLDVSQLAETIKSLSSKSTQDDLAQETLASIYRQSQQILIGMRDFKNAIRDNNSYQDVMDLHNSIGNTEVTGENDPQDFDYNQSKKHLPMSVYKKSVEASLPRVGNVATSVLHKSLREINKFLYGNVLIHGNTALVLRSWGPYTSLINHGCMPKAATSYVRLPDSTSSSPNSIGSIVLRSLCDIAADQEITIEYNAVFGTYVQRRRQLVSLDIGKCQCSNCTAEEHEHQHNQEANAAAEDLSSQTSPNTNLHMYFEDVYPILNKLSPVELFQATHSAIASMQATDYHGIMVLNQWDNACTMARRFNDNLRVMWFANFLIQYTHKAFLPQHWLHQAALKLRDDAANDTIFHQDSEEYLTLYKPFTTRGEDVTIVFMLDQDDESEEYHQLKVTEEGHLAYISEEDKEQEGEEARAAADEAAAELAAEVEAAAAKKERAKEKKKEKARRKKEKAAAVETRLAERIAAVRAATVVPALPLPRAARAATATTTTAAVAAAGEEVVGARVSSPSSSSTTSPPTPPPHLRHFSSSSNPEAATVARFLAGEPLRPMPSAFEDVDCVSEGGWEIRFGVGV